MRRSKLQLFTEYRYGPRGVLTRGDRFRVSGGPVYITDAGKTPAMFERGLFVFERYCVRALQKWIEAFRVDGGGMVILWVGKSGRCPTIPNYRRRPYRIRS